MAENLTILTVNSTHFYLIDLPTGKLLVDAGWEWARFQAQMQAHKIPLSAIRWVMFTHSHPDHAGLVQAVREASGARLIVHPVQLPYLEELNTFAQKKPWVRPIHIDAQTLITAERADLQAIGLHGQILETPGHSPDHVTLLLDSGAAFTGDLPAPRYIDPLSQPAVLASWRTLLAHGAQTFYPSHAAPLTAEAIREQLET